METPATLWSEGVVYIPEILVTEYRNQLKKEGIYDRVLKKKELPKNRYGGRSESETLDYFAFSFANCVSRVEYLILDPRKEFSTITNNLKIFSSDGNISILDVITEMKLRTYPTAPEKHEASGAAACISNQFMQRLDLNSLV